MNKYIKNRGIRILAREIGYQITRFIKKLSDSAVKGDSNDRRNTW